MKVLLATVVLATALAASHAAHAQTLQPPPSSQSNPFMGGVPTEEPQAAPVSLSIGDAIFRALDHNLGVLTAEERIGRAKGTRWRALGELLPNVTGRVSESRQQINLEAFGFPLPAGFPSIVGPFNVFDARLSLSQSILDYASLSDARAEGHNVAAAELSYKSARDVVVLVAANAYLQALATAARADSVQAQVQTAQAIYDQAVDLKQNGIVAGIDVLRADVQLGTEKQRATAANNDREKARLQLARIIGLPAGQAFTLSDVLPNVPAPDMTLDQALERAYASRADYQAAVERVKAAEEKRRSVSAERLPSVHLNADFGDSGLTAADSHSVFSITGAVNVPIFQGDTKGRLIEAEADLNDRRSEAADLKAGIYYDVKSAFLDLEATREQLEVATRGRDLAAQQLVQARDRFAAGIANNIEVVQAQEAVALASDQYISALYGYNLAKGLLARGIGDAEQGLRQILGGSPNGR
ncbi:MAG TPA: TolC family protein [Vicinamibacterales bacterium]|nr:TolC family protein [Vicinamibacterales bacterium]